MKVSSLLKGIRITVFLVFLGTYSYSQNNMIRLDAGTSFGQEHFIFTRKARYEARESWVNQNPSLNIGLSYSRRVNDNWIIGVRGGYFRTRVDYDDSEFRDASGHVNDYKPEYSIRNYFFSEIHGGFSSAADNKWGLRGLLTLNFGVPFSSFDNITLYTGENQDLPIYTGNGRRNNGFLFGPGIELGVVLNPSKYYSKNSFSYGVSVQTDLLFYNNESDYNPKLLFGPEVSVMYNF